MALLILGKILYLPVQAVFLTLKLTGVVGWAWPIVLLPTIIAIIVFGGLMWFFSKIFG